MVGAVLEGGGRLVLESGISGGGDFIGEINIEVESHRYRKLQARAHAVLYGVAQQQGVTLAYIDTFWVLGVIAAIMFGLSFALKRNEPGQAEAHAE